MLTHWETTRHLAAFARRDAEHRAASRALARVARRRAGAPAPTDEGPLPLATPCPGLGLAPSP